MLKCIKSSNLKEIKMNYVQLISEILQRCLY